MCLVHALREVLHDADRDGDGAVHLLRTRKLLFMPLANPDGYAWNAQRRPRGGGMKRKNGARTCSPPDTENDGVDLNRNFGYKYAYDNTGSSSRGCSEEYRGTGAFSEPETQAIRAVVAKHRPKIILHWHGWGNDIAFPYSFDWRAPMSNEDLGMYQEFATEMAATNHYASGRAWESVGYTTNGEADDWGWGDAGAVSLTIEVGSSQDGFWPSPARILPIARESAFPARYAAWAAGPVMQLDSISVEANEQGDAGELTLTMQNNGLMPYTQPRLICVQAVPGSGTVLKASAAWSAQAEGGGEGTDGSMKGCVTIQALGKRAAVTLPALGASWTKDQKWIALTITSQPANKVEAAGSHIEAFQLKVYNSIQTVRGCDGLCMCPSADMSLVEFSHECRATVPPGSHCTVAKPAHIGSNWASGVLDEHFKYTATKYSRGGKCTVTSVKRDTLVAVYAECARFGAQSALGFANSESGRVATVTFPCTAGTSYDIFWNAEYMPGRFSFTITEACSGSDCVFAHRHRHSLRWRHKQRRSK